jgi:hypothetical protein
MHYVSMQYLALFTSFSQKLSLFPLLVYLFDVQTQV